jgi:hypothetical protein
LALRAVFQALHGLGVMSMEKHTPQENHAMKAKKPANFLFEIRMPSV